MYRSTTKVHIDMSVVEQQDYKMMKQHSIFNAEFVAKTVDKGQWHDTFHAKQMCYQLIMDSEYRLDQYDLIFTSCSWMWCP